MNEMTETSAAFFERSQKVAPGGVHSPVRSFRGVGGSPIFFRRSEGAYLESVEGDRYLDFCMSFGPLVLGHRDPEVQEAVHEMIDTAWTFGACEPYSLELAELVKEQIPFIDKIRFVASGTEAVMSALRVARAATGRSKILKFDGCYHGHVDSMLVKSGSGLAGLASSDSAGVSDQVASETLVCPLDDEASLSSLFQQYGKEIAAVIIEPLPANYGLLEQRGEFLKLVESLCRSHGALLIFDEVISGFRVSMQGMAGRVGITPDLVTYGKVLGGGFNVGAYAGKAEWMDMVAPSGPVYQAGTLSANPIGMRAGLVTLKKMIAQDVLGETERRTSQFRDFLNQAFESRSIDLRVLSVGSLFWIHPPTEKPIRRNDQIPASHGDQFARLFRACLGKGVYLAPSGYEVGFLSYAHTEEILSEAAEKIVEAATEVMG